MVLLGARLALGACAGLFTGTPCTATVGAAGRNYPALQECVNAIPANLVADGNSYVCSAYNDGLFTAPVSISGKTTDATHYITVTAAPGQSFTDAPAVRSNALTFDQSKGAAISINAAYTTVLACSVSYTRISRLQARNTSTGGGGNVAIQTSGSAVGIEIRDVIADSIAGGGSSFGVVTLNAGSSLINALVVSRSGAAGIVNGGSGNLILGSTIVRPWGAGASQTGIVATTGTPAVQSSAIFGFSTASSGTFAASSQKNATNLASGLPGTGNVYDAAWSAATPFVNGATDYRALGSTPLVGAGYRDSANAANDISGTPRGASPTIGAWEATAGAAATTARRRIDQ
jgi:hypothetical protein